MALTPIERTADKLGTALENFFNRNTQSSTSNTYVSTGQTCLEKAGMEARKTHLMRNEWRKDLVYSKPLVLEEYMIQTEFLIDTTNVTVEEQRENITKKSANKKSKKSQPDEIPYNPGVDKPIEPVEMLTQYSGNFENSNGTKNWENDTYIEQ